jgi:hypothetical protein
VGWDWGGWRARRVFTRRSLLYLGWGGGGVVSAPPPPLPYLHFTLGFHIVNSPLGFFLKSHTCSE